MDDDDDAPDVALGRIPVATNAEALRVLENEKGTKYDPDCVEALSRALRPTRDSIPVSGLLGN